MRRKDSRKMIFGKVRNAGKLIETKLLMAVFFYIRDDLIDSGLIVIVHWKNPSIC
ncbi:hypothetical protein PBN151_3597 [Paenibacillus sp. NAIST15-1]|nr:hypothetical protein PBN151_3597 [Paenibacillus sp. NAIST15-1]